MKRYVIMHGTYGVYLGDGRWSGINPKPGDFAVTFEEANPVKLMFGGLPEDAGFEIVHAVPDKPGFRASQEALDGIAAGWDDSPPTQPTLVDIQNRTDRLNRVSPKVRKLGSPRQETEPATETKPAKRGRKKKTEEPESE